MTCARRRKVTYSKIQMTKKRSSAQDYKRSTHTHTHREREREREKERAESSNCWSKASVLPSYVFHHQQDANVVDKAINI